MPMRLRKFIGLLVFLAWILVYVLFAWGIALRILPHATGLVALLFYAVAGTAWIFPVRYLFRWMQRPDPDM